MDVETSLIFYVNGKKIHEAAPQLETTLLQYLRQQLRLTGSKNACNQGGCGACTVLLSKYDREEKKIRHFTVNACITLLCSIHGYAVTTVEGVGNVRHGLHPIQENLVKSHGIQCGFCTPGMVMTLYCLLRKNKHPDQEDVERALEGNLCRCTGYRPIIDAMKPFYDCPMGDECCKIKVDKDNEFPVKSGCMLNDPTQEVIFPPELMRQKDRELTLKTPQWTWMKPTNLQRLLHIKRDHPDSKIVMGATALGYLIKTGKLKHGVIVDCTEIPEMKIFATSVDGINIGAAVTVSNLEEKLNDLVFNQGGNTVPVLLKCIRQLAADQIRNMATIGGHIAHADPLSDLNPLLVATGSKVKVVNVDGKVRTISMDNCFFLGAYKTLLSRDDIIMSVHIPFLAMNEYLEYFKQSPSKGFSYAIVNAALYLSMDDNNKIEKVRFCFGGISNSTHMLAFTGEAPLGLILDDLSVARVIDSVINDVLKTNRTIEKYRLTLASSFVFKFLKRLLSQNKNSAEQFVHSPCKSAHVFESVPEDQNDNDAVGRPIPLLSGTDIVSGQAQFIDDLPRYDNELFLCPVLSTKAHARILCVDPSAALAVTDVVEYIDHRSVAASNMWGYLINDEELFASEKVHTYGQLIGGVLAESRETARNAAKLVKIEYEDLKPILTIEDAIEANSFFEEDKKTHERGNVTEGFENSHRVSEGTIKSGAQDHFYMEPLSVIAVPKIEQSEMELYVGIQTPTLLQKTIASFLGVPANRIIIRHRRTGGAFGGKESQPLRVCGPAAIAAARTGRPVRCILDRWENFQNAGKRHPYLTKYKVGFTEVGRITSLCLNIYSNVGHSLDVSNAIMTNSLRMIDNCYNIPNFRVTEYLCRTNTTSNTTFRGAGGPQAIVAIETVIMDVATTCGKTHEEIREMHFFKEGDTTLCNMPLINCNIQKCWSECKQDSKYLEKKMEVDAFNRTSKWIKRGISMMPLKFPVGIPFMFLNQGSALIHILLDGSVSLSHGGCEIGQGINTKMVQVASRALGVPIKKIYTGEFSSTTIANSTTTGASVTSDVIGAAVYDGCMKLKERLKPFMEKDPEASWEELVIAAYQNRISLSAIGFGTPEVDVTGIPFLYFTFGAVCSVVEIDCLTGNNKVLSTVIVMDVGKSLNPAIDIGQIEGGFMQGYGMVTSEQIKMTQDGVPVCNGPLNYKIPCVGDIPREFRVTLLKDCQNTKALYSSKGIGEPPLLLAVSVFLAIKDAVLSSRRENGLNDNFEFHCPATTERIRMACEENISKQCDSGTKNPLVHY